MKKGALSFNSLIKIVLVSMFIFIGFLVLRDGVQPTMDRILDVFSLEARSSSSGSGAHQGIRDGQNRAADVFRSLVTDLNKIKDNENSCFALLEPIPKDLFDDYNITFQKSGNNLDFSLIPKQGIGDFRYNIDNINLCVVTNAKDQQSNHRSIDVRNIFINDANVKCAENEVLIERSGRLKIDGTEYRIDSMGEKGVFVANVGKGLFILPVRGTTLANRGCTFRGNHFTTPCFDYESTHFKTDINDRICEGFENRFGG